MATHLRTPEPRIKVAWARDLRGRQPAKDFFDGLSEIARRAIARTMARIESGDTTIDAQHFKRITHDLYEIKKHQVRLIGGYIAGAFTLAHGLIKKQDELPPAALEIARRIMREHVIGSASQDFVARHTPKPDPAFRPTLVSPPSARPDPAPVPPEPDFRQITSEYAWAYVQTRDLLPPEAPLMQSLVRLPRLHNILVRDELAPYIQRRLTSMSPDARLALGLLADEAGAQLMLGAIWGIELLTSRALAKEYPATAVPDPAPPPAPTPIQRDGPMPKLYWVTHSGGTGKRRIRLLYHVIRTARRYGRSAPAVQVRAYFKKTKRWSSIKMQKAAMFTCPANPQDPIVAEAMERLP